MINFFKYLYKIIGSKFFKIIIVLSIICVLFLTTFKNNVNSEKFKDALKLVKENSTKDKFDKKYGTNDKVIKKQIVKSIDIKVANNETSNDENNEQQNEKVEKIKKITNVLLKLKELDDNYRERVENGKIDYNRVIKNGDAIYYSLKSIINNVNNQSNNLGSTETRLFMIVKEQDDLSKKILGKKIGQKIHFNYNDLLANVTKEEKKQVNDIINEKIDRINKKLANNETLKQYSINHDIDISYEITLLDFIDQETIDRLDLIENE